MKNNSGAHLFDDPPPQSAPSNNHTGLKLVGLVVVFVIVIVLVLVCYCGWKHKGMIAEMLI
jgi:heme/copper-type cytochrome/quinol oxidase subunit 2